MKNPNGILSLLHLINGRSANVGNGALTEGVEFLLSQDIGRSIQWSRLAWDDYTFGVKTFNHDFVNLINSNSDGMIINGAVAINGREFYANAGMRFNLPEELWGKIRKPLVFYGLSYRHWNNQVYHHEEKLKWVLDYIGKHDNILLAFRNDGTREWLKNKFSINVDNFFVVPDPGVFLSANVNEEYDEFEQDRPNVILALNDEDSDYRYGNNERRLSVLKNLAIAVERMIKKWDVNLILVPHYFDDCRMLCDFIELCEPQVAHQRMIATGLARINGSRSFYGRYAKADMVISMRVHSMSPSIGLGTPMIPLVTQERMIDFLKAVNLQDLAIDAFSHDLTDRLNNAIDFTFTNQREIRKRFNDAKVAMRHQASLFNDKVRTLFNLYANSQ